MSVYLIVNEKIAFKAKEKERSQRFRLRSMTVLMYIFISIALKYRVHLERINIMSPNEGKCVSLAIRKISRNRNLTHEKRHRQSVFDVSGKLIIFFYVKIQKKGNLIASND